MPGCELASATVELVVVRPNPLHRSHIDTFDASFDWANRGIHCFGTSEPLGLCEYFGALPSHDRVFPYLTPGL